VTRGETRLAVNDERAGRRDDGRNRVEFDELGYFSVTRATCPTRAASVRRK
jgi:hypothetical protein